MNALEIAPSCRLLCPRQERFNEDKDVKVITVNDQDHHIIESSYCISDVENEKFNHPHSLLRRNKKEDEENGLWCWACFQNIISKTYYLCNHCGRNYHTECVESPSIFQSSHHPKHPLQLLWYNSQRYSYHKSDCFSCKDRDGYLFYYCDTCDFMIHPVCARNSTFLTIDNPKRHEHTLHYFPRKSTLICDVCALEGHNGYLYVCLICDFIVHKQCVYLSYVIKVSRHNHRIAFTPNHPSKEWISCGVCHAKINGNYGHYSCMRGCAYAMHSRCAMRSDVSDGKELEGEPEEAYEDIKMFEEKGDGIIQHLSHPRHQMRLDKKIQRFYDENKRCQACILPFYGDGNVYRCMECDFSLHESCAYIPRVKQFMLHVHQLILEFGHTTSRVTCKKCYRDSCGFRYVCGLQTCGWVIDTHCASICEPFDHHTHPHPLFLTCAENTWKNCSICQSSKRQPLNCVECDFVLCFGCATLPHKAMYENDDHLLTFSYEKDVNKEFYWCEICEKDINPKKEGLYACNECGITLHIECFLGKDPYLKPRQTFTLRNETIIVLPNTCSTRQRCKKCRRRCSYKIKIESSRKGLYCSFDCYDEYDFSYGQ